MENTTIKNKLTPAAILGFIIILLTATFFQFYQLGQVPPGLFPDEAAFAIDGLEVLEGQFLIYSPDEGGAGALWRYLLAPYFALFGATIFSLRAFASIIGVLSVGMTYWVVRELRLSPIQTGPQAGIAFLAALFMAVSYWHVDQSRPAFPTVLMLLLQNTAFFFLWRALNSGRWPWFIGAGVGLGLMMYNYLPGKIVPLVSLFFLLIQALIGPRPALLVKYWRRLVTAGGLAALVALPIFIFAFFNYQMLIERAALPTGAVASMPPVQGLIANLAVFGLWPTYWLSGAWGSFFLGVGLTLGFVVGVGVSLVRLRQPAYLFLLVWWLTMLLPGALAPEGTVPHARRSIGALTPTMALTALGLTTVVFGAYWLVRRLFQGQSAKLSIAESALPLSLTLIIGVLLAAQTGLQTFQRYFVEWGTSEEAQLAFHVYDLELADLMARESGPETVYLLPLDSSAGIVNPLLDSITFVYQGDAAYDFLSDDETQLLAHLSALTAGKQMARLLTWKVTKHTQADPKAVAPYYLEKWGRWVERKSYTYFDIDTYEVFAAPNAFVAEAATATKINFEEKLALTTYAFGPEYVPEALQTAAGVPLVPAGDLLWVELAWRKVGQIAADYQVGVWLADDAGHIVAQPVDKLLLNNIGHQRTSAWEIGAEERDYYLLPVDPTTLPGIYRLKAILYDRETGQRLAPNHPDVGADLAFTLGAVEVGAPHVPPDPSQLPIPHRLDAAIGAGLQLLGVDFGFDGPLRPGDQKTLQLWWQATTPISQNVALAVGLSQNDQVQLLGSPETIGGADFPTSRWPPGTVGRTFFDIRVPAEIETGPYNLGLRLFDADSEVLVSDVVLGQAEVVARARTFAVPTLSQKIEANYDNQLTLLGYNLDLTQAETKQIVRLELVWQAQAEMDTAYKAFVHFLDDSGQIVAQIDQEPQQGQAPTTGWLPGEVVADAFELPADENLNRVSQVSIGLYDLQNGERLPVLDSSNQVEDTKITIDFK